MQIIIQVGIANNKELIVPRSDKSYMFCQNQAIQANKEKIDITTTQERERETERLSAPVYIIKERKRTYQ